MLFAQFYHMSTGYIPGTIPPQFGEKKPIDVCGDRGVIVLDGRVSRSVNEYIARSECKNRGYIGYSIHKGDTFTRSTCIVPFKGV